MFADQVFTIKTAWVGILLTCISGFLGVAEGSLLALVGGSFFAVCVIGTMSFWRGIKNIIGGVFAAGLVTAVLMAYTDNLPERPSAAILAFVFVYCQEDLLAWIKTTVKSLPNNIPEAIERIRWWKKP